MNDDDFDNDDAVDEIDEEDDTPDVASPGSFFQVGRNT